MAALVLALQPFGAARLGGASCRAAPSAWHDVCNLRRGETGEVAGQGMSSGVLPLEAHGGPENARVLGRKR